ncbi:hypothetical protein C2S52_019344 [Perilla frutescens var. hirtella]|nr:hypothetical protein C2S52_019344 [Perilla frutescens var. hirtella]
MERGPGEPPEMSSSQIDWVRLPLRSRKTLVVVYAIPSVIDTIRDTLLAIGGDVVRLFRLGCFGYFLDYRGGDVQKRVIHALMTFEVHAPDRARVGREAWFHIHHSQLRFGPSEYTLVSDLRFGSSTFDPHDDHIVPSRYVYHRLFEGKRTTIKQMEDRFKDLGMARDAADYVKVANILFVYRMILCLDQYRYVDPWVWALAEDVERWNSFPWGAYSYQSLMHYIGLVPKTRKVMGGKGSGQYHFYGPIWALQVWACEVIPELASEAGVHSGQLTVPRCLRWTFSLPATDPATLLQRASRVVMLEPSPEEMATSYYMSMQLEPGTQSVRFVPARSGNKKKMLANVTSCCSTSAEEEALVGAWKILHPIDPLCRATYGDDDYRRWKPAEGLAIVVCDVSGEHWVVVRIRFSDWVVELYDSLLFQMDDPSDRVEYEMRDRELMPLLRLLPRLLICAGFWEGRPMPPRCAFTIILDKFIPDQYVQTDATSCGVYACIYVERLLGAGPPPDISEQTVHEYRKVIGARIYSLTYIQRPGV